MNKQESLKLAKHLDQAALEAREVARLTETKPDLSLMDAYEIQAEGIQLRLARGERVIGYKMGLTSKAKMDQMGLNTPIYGVLTDKMLVQDGATFSLTGKIHPKIEPEIAFHISKDLRGQVTVDEAIAAVSGVSAAMEILDSRFVGFKYFSLPDVVADNSSSAYFVVSKTQKNPTGMALASFKMNMEVNKQPVQEALSSAILGNPINSLVHLCSLLDSHGLYLKAGSIVLAGAATQAIPLVKDSEVTLTVSELGTVTIKVAN